MMLLLIVLANMFSVGVCALFPGGYAFSVPANEFHKYLAMAKPELSGLQATDQVVVNHVTVQVQSFIENVKGTFWIK